jgi:tryptophan synthase alpha chain
MKELVAYITCSLPDKTFTTDAVLTLKEAGADRIELGLPFSDPVADGETIELANQKALRLGFKSHDAFGVAKVVSEHIDTYLMGYFNAFYSNGLDSFCQKAKESGIKGFIIPDLPLEEGKRYGAPMNSRNLSVIQFLAVTDPKERIEQICRYADDFIYLVAFAGITGADKKEDLAPILEIAKANTKQKIFVGFGVNRDTAKDRAKGADGVIVGSAFVKILSDDGTSMLKKLELLGVEAKAIKEAINN